MPLLLAAVGAVALPWLPFVRLGELGYRPIAFIERVWRLRELSSIETFWVYPPAMAMTGAVAVVVAALLPYRWVGRWLPAVCLLLLVGAALVLRLVTASATASADIGIWLFLAVVVLVVLAWSMQRMSTRTAAGRWRTEEPVRCGTGSS